MANINIALLRSDIEDRLDNEVLFEQIPESVRQKLVSIPRVTRAMNQAMVLFARDADPATIQGLVTMEVLAPDTSIGAAGVAGNVKTYLWPLNAFTQRADGGLIKIILDEEEKYFDRNSNTSIESVRFQANNALYGNSHKVFHVDLVGKRIYTPSDVSVKARIVNNPLPITDSNQYDGNPDLPINDSFNQTFSDLAVQELKKMAVNYTNRERVIADTSLQAEPINTQGVPS